MNWSLKYFISKKLAHCIFFLFNHFWYIPLFVFLIGLKISMFILFIYSVKNDDLKSDSFVNMKYLPSSSKMQKAHKNSQVKMSIQLKMNSTHHHNHRQHDLSKSGLENDWKMLSDLENAEISPTSSNRTDPNSIWVIFNRVPGLGGERMVEFLHQLSLQNGFNHVEHEYRTPWPRFLLDQEQESLVTWFEYQHLPKSYDRHFYFINFTNYQKYVKEQPIYINLIQDPVEHLKYIFDVKRANKEIAKIEINKRNSEIPGSGIKWLEKDFNKCVLQSDPECLFENESTGYILPIPFFCGQHNDCVMINNNWALNRAKFIIEKYYSAVGIVERWTESLRVFEKYIPKFFANSTNTYKENYELIDEDDQIERKVREKLKSMLWAEFDLYQFVHQRLDLQIK